jgi:hypothetical protein
MGIKFLEKKRKKEMRIKNIEAGNIPSSFWRAFFILLSQPAQSMGTIISTIWNIERNH